MLVGSKSDGSFHDSINFDITSGNEAPNHDRGCLWQKMAENSHSCHSRRPVATDFRSSSFLHFSFLTSGFLTATLQLKPFLIRLQQTVDGSPEGPDASLRSWKCSYFLKISFQMFFKPVHSSSFLSFFKGSSYTIMRYAKWITLEVNDLQKAWRSIAHDFCTVLMMTEKNTYLWKPQI